METEVIARMVEWTYFKWKEKFLMVIWAWLVLKTAPDLWFAPSYITFYFIMFQLQTWSNNQQYPNNDFSA